MLGNYNLVTFILTADATRAKAFYRDTLGLKYLSEDPFAVSFDVNGILLRLTTIEGHKPAPHTVLGWNVPDIHKTTADLAHAGVPLEKYAYLDQDENGIWTAPDGAAKVGWFKDPEGNVLSISQHS
jgi:catechol 2,3-dioxygenase-like lactoylglutathione lyase family enzyme